MPVWLRLLGVFVCWLPVLSYLVSALRTESVSEVIGGLVFLLIFGFFVLLLFLVPIVLPPVCWLIGFRPGALAGSGMVGVIGLGLLVARGSESDLILGGLLCLHWVLCGVLAWEWRGGPGSASSKRSRQQGGSCGKQCLGLGVPYHTNAASSSARS